MKSARLLPALLLVALFGGSCVVPPSCFDQVFGLPGQQTPYLLLLSLHAGSVQEPPQGGSPGGPALREWFEQGSSIAVDTNGEMQVSSLGAWPERCPRIEEGDLARLLEAWQPALERFPVPDLRLRAMEDPILDESWRPDGPLLSLSFSDPSGKSLSLLWDGRSPLPEGIEAALLTTLDVACASSRLGRKYLLRDLPREVAGRLDCTREVSGSSGSAMG